MAAYKGDATAGAGPQHGDLHFLYQENSFSAELLVSSYSFEKLSGDINSYRLEKALWNSGFS